jgi:hypothetical protein
MRGDKRRVETFHTTAHPRRPSQTWLAAQSHGFELHQKLQYLYELQLPPARAAHPRRGEEDGDLRFLDARRRHTREDAFFDAVISFNPLDHVAAVQTTAVERRALKRQRLLAWSTTRPRRTEPITIMETVVSR